MISKEIAILIELSIKKLFNSLRLDLLGPQSVGSSINFAFKAFDPTTTLSSQYLSANSLHSINPVSVDKDAVEKINTVAGNYINSLEQKAIADITRIVSEKYDDISLKAKREGKDIREIVLDDYGSDLIKEIHKNLESYRLKIIEGAERIVNHEIHNSQNHGALHGIIEASKSMGITDPTVFKVLVDDERLCGVCRGIWLSKDGITPKVYKLSQLAASSKGPKDTTPSIAPQHINCRCVLSSLLPGFGFSGSGQIVYIGNGHDEYKKQNS